MYFETRQKYLSIIRPGKIDSGVRGTGENPDEKGHFLLAYMDSPAPFNKHAYTSVILCNITAVYDLGHEGGKGFREEF